MSAKYGKHYRRARRRSGAHPGQADGPELGGRVCVRRRQLEAAGAVPDPRQRGGLVLRQRAATDDREREVRRGLPGRDAAQTVRTIVEVSDAGRAPKNDPAVFALAIAAATGMRPWRWRPCRRSAGSAPTCSPSPRPSRSCAAGARRSSGASPPGTTTERPASWPTRSPSTSGARAGRTATCSASRTRTRPTRRTRRSTEGRRRPRGLGPREVKRGESMASYPDVSADLPAILGATEAAKKATTTAEIIGLIRDHDLPRECIPTEHLNAPEVWEALLEKMPMTALVRNLAKMTAVGLLRPGSAAARLVVRPAGRCGVPAQVSAAPVAILIAPKTYAGQGAQGEALLGAGLVVVDALDAAFYQAFANVEPAGKRTLLALDVSGSMTCGGIAGSSLTPREASAAMAMVTAKTEPSYRSSPSRRPRGYGGQWGGGTPG